MRTTIDLSDELFRQAKKRAASSGQTMKELIEQALRKHLTPAAKSRAYKLKVRPLKGTLKPGVRLENRSALWDLMDGRA